MTINGVLLSSIGVSVEWGFNATTRSLPTIKNNGLSINWVDENGTDRYFGTPKFESKTYNISFVCIGSSPQDFENKYNAFSNLILTGQLIIFDDNKKNRRYKLAYSRMTSYNQVMTYSARFSIEFIDDYPLEKFPIV